MFGFVYEPITRVTRGGNVISQVTWGFYTTDRNFKDGVKNAHGIECNKPFDTFM